MSASSRIALALSGGGARGAYQVGFLRHLARRHPDLPVEILTGASAGAVNAIDLANQMFQGDFLGRIIELGEADADTRADEIARFLER